MDSKKTKSNLEKAPIIYVEWVDAVADVEWNEKVKAEVHNCFTIGYLIDENAEAICIASTVSIDSSNARMHIPIQWIKNRKEIDIEAIISESKKHSKSVERKPIQNTNRRTR